MFNIITSSNMLAKAKDDCQSFKRLPTSHKMFNLFITIKHIEDYLVHEEKRTKEQIVSHFGKDLYDWMSFIANKEKHCTIINKKLKKIDSKHKQLKIGGGLNSAPVGSASINAHTAFKVAYNGTVYEMGHLADLLIKKWEELLK